MAYGHAERNLAQIRQLEAETVQLLGSGAEPDPEQSAWLRDVASQGKPTVTSAAYAEASVSRATSVSVSRGDSAASSAGSCSRVRALASGGDNRRLSGEPGQGHRGRTRRQGCSTGSR